MFDVKINEDRRKQAGHRVGSRGWFGPHLDLV